jgi:putative sterol carrier protein
MTRDRLQAITASFADNALHFDALEARLKFDLGVDGTVFLNGNVKPCAVTNENDEADCVVEIDLETLEAILSGNTDSRSAFNQGKICLIGDMTIAFKLVTLMNTLVVDAK